MSEDTLTPTLSLDTIRRGKVREVYRMTPDQHGGRVALVASDRVSAFDVVLPTPIAGKGAVLTEIAAWWFRFLEERRIVETHLLSTGLADLPEGSLTDESQRDAIGPRVTVARACRVIPIECVVRGYIEGSGWKDYQQSGRVCGHTLPPGLKRCDKLPEPLFTPTTKAEVGHDEPITFEQGAEMVGLETMTVLRDLSLQIYTVAAEYALERGIIIADTKFEFGIPEGVVDTAGRSWTQPLLIDEALTPDSSRFWPADGYAPGASQPSFDKQFVREHLQGLTDAGTWDKTPPGPELPADVVDGTLRRYREVRDLLMG